jgi:NAD(P)-dependent dehydrogenase (short-subunit alcohol dehydrogenase family)
MGVEYCLRSEREDRIRVVAAAPAAAETPATMAMVSFDMMEILLVKEES